MAVKCNIPGLALRQVQGLIYGFSCDNVSGDIVRNYLEYLHCPTVDYFICQDFPCVESEGTVFCFIDDVNLTFVSVTINTVNLSFTIPSQPYIIQIIRASDNLIVSTKQNPTSPVTFTGLTPATNYIAKFSLLCEGGEIKTEQISFLTKPDCVQITDYTGVPSDVNEYP